MSAGAREVEGEAGAGERVEEAEEYFGLAAQRRGDEEGDGAAGEVEEYDAVDAEC